MFVKMQALAKCLAHTGHLNFNKEQNDLTYTFTEI